MKIRNLFAICLIVALLIFAGCKKVSQEERDAAVFKDSKSTTGSIFGDKAGESGKIFGSESEDKGDIFGDSAGSAGSLVTGEMVLTEE